ncbi:MAG: methyltransferase domain-containing protein [Gaiellaceae bacterium]
MEPTEENVRAWDDAHPPAEQPERGLPPLVRERLPELKGRHVLHLSCGTGEATAELGALGAFVTAVDPSPADLVAARANAPTAAFVHAELDRLPLELLRSRFHLVYAARGTLVEVRDPDAYAQGVHGALRPGGYLLQHDDHPVIHRLDQLLHWRGDYFDGQRVRVDELVTALAQAALAIRRLEEFPSTDLKRRHDPRAPGELVLVAMRTDR